MNFLDHWLSFSRSEQKGIIFLVILMMILFGYRQYQIHSFKRKHVKLDEEFRVKAEKFIAQFEAEEGMDEEFTYKNRMSNDSLKTRNSQLFHFDPNTIKESDLRKLGLSDYVAGNIIAYRKHGGRFNQTSDLKKIYGLSSGDYSRIKGFIDLDSTREEVEKDIIYQLKGREEELRIYIDLNNAGKAELMKIRGIGPSFAERIIQYRSKLGGYYNLEQLREVYGLDSIKFNEINMHLFINDTLIKPLKVNSKKASELIKHPYIESWSVANAIENYRKQHGEYQNMDDLRKVHLLNDTILDKLKPYLFFH